ncbi:glycosyltransferase [Amnibacterium setariae]|uniref:4,4'-diaponeurosporenoate glycosyltransferase n=1 Tax=Amnibacterium setariae TaxID=2306585 RepID=A0A3A1U2G9_9MICO|nr:glycosyltransferase family 2 protein [Amnibacterium setariae]RIX31044.1 glycosyltransferase [Amnibacterium setariae]
MRGARPTCSVVVPVKDDGDPLERCLVALDAQRLRPDEVIVVDNGSSDASVAVAEAHGARVVREAQPGIAAAASAGYDAARSDLILRLDADSRPPADWTQRVVDRFVADPALDALSGPGEFMVVPRPLRRALTGWYWYAYFERIGRKVGGPPLFGSNLAMRRAAWERVADRVHREDQGIHDDLDLTVHLREAGCRLEVDPALLVPVSARPLLHPVGLIGRARKAEHTIALHPAR